MIEKTSYSTILFFINLNVEIFNFNHQKNIKYESSHLFKTYQKYSVLNEGEFKRLRTLIDSLKGQGINDYYSKFVFPINHSFWFLHSIC